MAANFLAARGIDINSVLSQIQSSGDAIGSGISSVVAGASEGVWRLSGTATARIVRARIPRKSPLTLWDIAIENGLIKSVEVHDPTRPSVLHLTSVLDAHGRLLGPSLCHAHVHLDKCYLLQDPKYEDLEVVEGGFDEAMLLTSKAKARFDAEDLLRRGGRLIEESMEAGVTVMRAFVEVDEIVETKCLDAGIKLKTDFDVWCNVQLCAFAQLPIFSGEQGQKRRSLLEEAISRQRVDVLGSTPYVEDDEDKMKQNVTWVIEKALAANKHVDFHLDYNLNSDTPALVWFVIDELKRLEWPTTTDQGKTVCLGHCTRLTLFNPEEWQKLREAIGPLPVSFIGLPTSDLFMMGRPDPGSKGDAQRTRGTLQIPEMIRKYNLAGAISINNLGNAFTPQGSGDPLGLASNGVAWYHAGTKQDTDLLYECISSRAKSALGCAATTLDFREGEPADFVLYGSKTYHWRRRKTIAELVYDPTSARLSMLRGKARRIA